MKLNTMFLSLLLVPFAIASINETNTKIENLKKTLLKKKLELSSLSKAIAEKEAFIDLMTTRERDFYSLICETSNDLDAEEFKKEIKEFQEDFSKTGLSKKNIKKFLLNKSLSIRKSTDEVERIKSWIIRYKIEYLLLKNLVENYEKCLLELIEIEIELEDLDN